MFANTFLGNSIRRLMGLLVNIFMNARIKHIREKFAKAWDRLNQVIDLTYMLNSFNKWSSSK